MSFFFSHVGFIAFDDEEPKERRRQDSSGLRGGEGVVDFSAGLSEGDLFFEELEESVAHPVFFPGFPEHEGEGLPPKNGVGIGKQVDGGVDEAMKEMIAFAGAQALGDGLEGSALAPSLEFPEKILPGGEVGVDRGPGDLGLARDMLDADRPQAAFGDFIQGHRQDAVPGGQALALALGQGRALGRRTGPGGLVGVA